jgi:hypothetical protein
LSVFEGGKLFPALELALFWEAIWSSISTGIEEPETSNAMYGIRNTNGSFRKAMR